MAENTSIEWCDHTYNPWRGCTKVSPGCAHCYAETLSKRNPAVLGVWGNGRPRVRASAAMWKQPLRWNAEAIRFLECPKCGWRVHDGPSAVCPTPDCLTFFSEMLNARPRVFCASLADWLDDEVPIVWLADLLDLIRRTPNLDWLLLTKRPQNFAERLALLVRHLDDGGWDEDEAFRFVHNWLEGVAPANVWVGTTVEDQIRAAERIPVLLSIPARVRFLSCEPLLGPINLIDGLGLIGCPDNVDWLIAGGESGPGARPMHPDWARSLRDQCATAAVPFLFKQWGEWGDATYGMKIHDSYRFPQSGPMAGDSRIVYRVGKKVAGRLLDGREHNEFPEHLQLA